MLPIVAMSPPAEIDISRRGLHEQGLHRTNAGAIACSLRALRTRVFSPLCDDAISGTSMSGLSLSVSTCQTASNIRSTSY